MGMVEGMSLIKNLMAASLNKTNDVQTFCDLLQGYRQEKSREVTVAIGVVEGVL